MARNQLPDAWTEYSRPLTCFDTAAPERMFSEHTSWAIVGPPGVGKSAFLLWAIDRAISLRETTTPTHGIIVLALEGRAPKHWFERVVFLNPARYDVWLDEIATADFDPETTMLAVDAPFRLGDSDEVKKIKADILATLTSPQRTGDEPYQFLVTLRPEELAQLSKLPPGYLRKHQIAWAKEQLWSILGRYLQYYGVVNEIGKPSEKLLATLEMKSEGLPLYCQALAAYLRSTRSPMTVAALDHVPAGVVNLMLQVFEKTCPQEETREVIFPLIALLAHSNQALSEELFNHIIDDNDLVPHSNRRLARKAWSQLESYYLVEAYRIDGRLWRRLGFHWVKSVEHVVKHFPADLETYLDSAAVLRRCWLAVEAYEEHVAMSVLRTLSARRDPTAAFPLLIDLPKLGDGAATTALQMWNGGQARIASLRLDLSDAITKRFYEALVDRAFKTAARDKSGIEAIVHKFDAAFSVRADTKDMMVYTGFLRRVGPVVAHGQVERESWKAKIAGVYDRLVALNPLDRRSLRARAGVWEEVGEYDKAEADFQRAAELKTANPLDDAKTIYAFAMFLIERANASWKTGDQEARRLLGEGKLRFGEVLSKLETVDKSVQADKTRTLAFGKRAEVLVEEARRSIDWAERRELVTQAVSDLRKALLVAPVHSHIVHVLTSTLMRYGHLVPEYRDKRGEHLRAAQELLDQALQRQRDLVTVQLLGRLLGMSGPGHQPNYDVAVQLLEESAQAGTELHISSVHYDLGRLYLGRARRGTLTALRRMLLETAEHHFQLAITVAMTPNTYGQLIGAYTSLAQVSLYKGDFNQTVEWLDKLARVCEQARQLAPVTLRRWASLLADFGDECLEEGNVEVAKLCFEKAVVESTSPWYPYARLGYCYAQLHQVKECLSAFHKAGQSCDAAAAFGFVRNAINGARKRIDTTGSLIAADISAFRGEMLYNSRNAYNLRPDYWKNCSDFSEDLLATYQSEEFRQPDETECHHAVLQDAVGPNRALREAIEKAREGMRLYRIEVSDALRSQGGKLWVKSTIGETRARLNWTIGTAYLKLGESGSARDHLWRSARQEKKERGWYQLALIEEKSPNDTLHFLLAFERFLKAFRNLEAEGDPLAARRLKRLLSTAKERYATVGDTAAAGLAAKYSAMLRRGRAWGKSRSEWFGLTGNWLLRLDEHQLAIECFLNALRLEAHSAFRAKNLTQLASSARSVGATEFARKVCQEALSSEGTGKWQQRLRIELDELGDGRPLTPIEAAMLKELEGDRGDVLEVYREFLATRTSQGSADLGAFSLAGALRIATDGFILQNDPKDAAIGLERLGEVVTFPETVYLKALALQQGNISTTRD